VNLEPDDDAEEDLGTEDEDEGRPVGTALGIQETLSLKP